MWIISAHMEANMQKRFVRPLTGEEVSQLARTYRQTSNADLVRRCHAILLSSDGRPVPEIAKLLRVDQSCVHRWLDRFEAGGIEALVTESRPGRPNRWDESYEVLLVETVRHDPRWYGLEQSLWTCQLLAGYLVEQTGIQLSAERVRVLLHRHGIRLKQPTLVVHSHDPEYHPKGLGPR
jgi:transposase